MGKLQTCSSSNQAVKKNHQNTNPKNPKATFIGSNLKCTLNFPFRSFLFNMDFRFSCWRYCTSYGKHHRVLHSLQLTEIVLTVLAV